jgi:predicted signal transduction protein with EAL and GGDEF domain
VREGDLVARLGGDEFAVLQAPSGQPEAATSLAQRLVDVICAPYDLLGYRAQVGVSIGIALADGFGGGGAAAADQMLKQVDMALYHAKGAGRRTWRFFEASMAAELQARLAMEADLREALPLDQLEVMYQPIFELRANRLSGFEALLRWRHPTRGTIGPTEFIPIAEETGAIVALGHWVLRQACVEAQRWTPRPGRPPLTLSVNVSARQLRGDGLVEHVREALLVSGLEPRRLVLEITETQVMRDVGQAVATLKAVKALGVRVAIDDFGTGYSSLSQLQKLPVDVLKVDREFTLTDEDGASEHAGMLSAVMEIGDSLGLRTVAEGIETPAQLRQLRALNYRYGQGFLFSHPVTAERVPELLATPVDVLTGRKVQI